MKTMHKMLIADISYALAYAQEFANHLWDSGDRYGIWNIFIDILDRCRNGVATMEEWHIIMDLYYDSHTHNGQK